MARSDKELDAWVVRVAPRAIAYARTLLDRPDAAEDLVQDVLCRLLGHRHYDLLRDGERLLFRSITNACINAATRRKELVSLEAQNPDGASLSDVLSAEWPGDPADLAASHDLLAAVERELMRLPALQRAAVELRAMGRTIKEVAETLKVTPSNAGVLVHRGRKALRERLGPMLPGELP